MAFTSLKLIRNKTDAQKALQTYASALRRSGAEEWAIHTEQAAATLGGLRGPHELIAFRRRFRRSRRGGMGSINDFVPSDPALAKQLSEALANLSRYF